MTKEQALPILMRGTAIAMGASLGLSHLFFPTWYFHLLGQTNWDGADPFHRFLVHVIGVLVLALCAGIWHAARDPRRYRLVIGQFFIASALIVPVYLYHLVFTGAIGGMEWLVLVGVVALNYGFFKLYPGADYKG